MHEFRDYENVDDGRNSKPLFYCDLCHLELSSRDYECVAHFSDYVHLFRYTVNCYVALFCHSSFFYFFLLQQES